jgi:hypothetical protein
VFVDGLDLGNPVYNNYREDIATNFPGYNNSDGAVGYFYLDTTAYENGVHTIVWGVTDDDGNADGIGSRFFTVFNAAASASSTGNPTGSSIFHGNLDAGRFSSFREDFSSPVVERMGRSLSLSINPLADFYVEKGGFVVTMEEVELLKIHLFPAHDQNRCQGYLKVGQELRPLPIGSTLDRNKGIFYWSPGPGFLGEYEFLFIHRNTRSKKIIKVNIKPKSF